VENHSFVAADPSDASAAVFAIGPSVVRTVETAVVTADAFGGVISSTEIAGFGAVADDRRPGVAASLPGHRPLFAGPKPDSVSVAAIAVATADSVVETTVSSGATVRPLIAAAVLVLLATRSGFAMDLNQRIADSAAPLAPDGGGAAMATVAEAAASADVVAAATAGRAPFLPGR